MWGLTRTRQCRSKKKATRAGSSMISFQAALGRKLGFWSVSNTDISWERRGEGLAKNVGRTSGLRWLSVGKKGTQSSVFPDQDQFLYIGKCDSPQILVIPTCLRILDNFISLNFDKDNNNNNNNLTKKIIQILFDKSFRSISTVSGTKNSMYRDTVRGFGSETREENRGYMKRNSCQFLFNEQRTGTVLVLTSSVSVADKIPCGVGGSGSGSRYRQDKKVSKKGKTEEIRHHVSRALRRVGGFCWGLNVL
jgi:hypothetical protein